MSKFTKELVDLYADKLLIGLTPEENKMVLDEFDVIDQNMEIISSFPDISSVEPMTHTLDNFEFTPREDESKESVDVDLLLQNCSNKESREVEVPRVVG